MKRIIHTDAAPAAVGPYSQAVRAGDFVFVSGQLGMNPDSGTIVDGGLERQVHQALENLGAILEEAGSGLQSVVKTTVLLQSIDDFKAMNAVYETYFTEEPPARAAFEVGRLPLGALVEIEAVAYLG
jgi:2-iminobutanoate/2-iminopropanoate deaminase